jgi:hypothetical protein
VIVLATLGAAERRRFARRRRTAEPEPQPAPVTTARATVIDVEAAFERPEAAAAWLRGGGLDDLDAALAVLNRVLHAFRLVTADPAVGPVARHVALVARLGYGAGEQVADGLWEDAIELVDRPPRASRAKVLAPQARLAAVLAGRERALVCEELILRARLDIDHRRHREAALQVLIALDGALAELGADPRADQLATRLAELHARRDEIAEAAQAALAGPLDGGQLEAVTTTLGRLEAVLRARAVLNA